MMGERRVVLVLRAERILKPKRRGARPPERWTTTGDGEPPATPTR